MDSELERDRYELERDRYKLEERRFNEELKLKTEELALQRQRKGVWGQLFSPVGVAVLAAAIGLLGTAINGGINTYNEYGKREAELQLERTKQESALILETAKIQDEVVRSRNLLFYAERGFLPSLKEKDIVELSKKARLFKEQVVPVPSVPDQVNAPLVGVLGTEGAANDIQTVTEYIKTNGYTLKFAGRVNGDERWFAKVPTVFYYSDNTKQLAEQLASKLEEKLGRQFITTFGGGYDVPTDQQRNWLLYIHIPDPTS
jgi:hypothetical protein